MKSDTFVSIVMRSYNEAWALKETLPALRRQRHKNWELIVIDSGSTDGSVELIRMFSPAALIQIKSEDYIPGVVLNRGMEEAKSDIVLFLNADATPQGDRWFEPLIEALENPNVAAAFSRQVPRPDCRAVFANDYERCFGPNRESRDWDHFFSMVSSGLRRDAWERRGFREDIQYAEDDEYTRWCLERGFEVRYCPESVAMHSHNYTAPQAYRRAVGDARAQAATSGSGKRFFSFPKTVAAGWLRDLRTDLSYCCQNRRLSELPHAAAIRWNQRTGRLAGLREGWNERHLNNRKTKA